MPRRASASEKLHDCSMLISKSNGSAWLSDGVTSQHKSLLRVGKLPPPRGQFRRAYRPVLFRFARSESKLGSKVFPAAVSSRLSETDVADEADNPPIQTPPDTVLRAGEESPPAQTPAPENDGDKKHEPPDRSPIYVDDSAPATLRYGETSVSYPTTREAINAWLALRAEIKRDALIITHRNGARYHGWAIYRLWGR